MTTDIASDNEQTIRRAYKIAENKDIEGWIAAFTPDGIFTDQSIGVSYRGPEELSITVQNYARAFPDMHREVYQMYSTGNIVVVQLALQGTHLGPLSLPIGTVRPTGKRMNAPCCDVFERDLLATVFVADLPRIRDLLAATGWTGEGSLGPGASLLAREQDGGLFEFVEITPPGGVGEETS